MNSKRVFISHSMDDRPLVKSALKWLRESELGTAEIDNPMELNASGEDMRSLIRDKIRQADTVLLLWSDQAAESAWVQYEVGMAQALGVPILVLMAGGSRAELPAGLANGNIIKIESSKPRIDSAPVEAHVLKAALDDLAIEKRKIEGLMQGLQSQLGTRSRKLTGVTKGTAARNRTAGAQKRGRAASTIAKRSSK